MFVTVSANGIHVILSRRNLWQLNAMLDDADDGVACLARRNGDGVALLVAVEDDADHFRQRNASLSATSLPVSTIRSEA